MVSHKGAARPTIELAKNGTWTAWPALPLSRKLLERYRLANRQKLRPDLLGGHLVRRRGQSLEFREYEHYLPGDDIRHVDWRASARYGQATDLLTRSYVAEEQLTLVLSIDTRATMYLPEAVPKLQMALWLAEAIAGLALLGGDRVILHRLFGPGPGSLVSLRGAAARGRVRPALGDICARRLDDEEVNLKPLQRLMPPTAVWLILSDLYFDQGDPAKALARALVSANDGMRWVILLDLDSWPAERHLLGTGARRVEGPGLVSVAPYFEIDEQALATVAASIETHKRHFLSQARSSRLDLDPWLWPGSEKMEAVDFFRDRFLGDTLLPRLFMQEKRA